MPGLPRSTETVLCTVTLAVAVTAAPLLGVTVRVYVVVVVGLTVTATPLIAAILPGVITPVPLAKTPVRVALCPVVMVVGRAVRLALMCAGFTVTMAVAVMVVPMEEVTVSV